MSEVVMWMGRSWAPSFPASDASGSLSSVSQLEFDGQGIVFVEF